MEQPWLLVAESEPFEPRRGPMIKRVLAALAVALFIGGLLWWSMVQGYEPNRGTDNVVEVEAKNPSTAGSTDLLASVAFQPGGEPLLWSSVDMTLVVNGTSYACGFGQRSLPSAADALIHPVLGADGQTFTTVVDATDEEAFTFVSIPHQREGNASNHSLRFSSTDIFVGEGHDWAFLENVGFDDVVSSDNISFSNNTEERLEWYTYDLSVHRVTPTNGVYVFQFEGVHYKVKFVSYYNEDDERRYPTMLVASLDASAFPALDDPTLVSPAPCLLQAGDGELVYWNATETVELYEQNVNIRQDSTPMVLQMAYEGVEVRIVEITATSTEQ